MDALTKDLAVQQLSKGEKTRLAILQGSIGCFVRLGFEGASITEISQACRVNRALVNHYFDSKEALIQEALRIVGASGRTFTEDYLARADRRERAVRSYLRSQY